MSAVKINVIVTCYNHAQYVRTALDSLLAQTSAPDRVYFFDDGSTDGSREIALELLGRTPRLWVAPDITTNKGLIPRLIQTLGQVEDGYVMHLACDDLLNPRAVEIHRTLLEKHRPGWSIGTVDVVDQNLALLARHSPVASIRAHGNDAYRAAMHYGLEVHGWCYSIDMYRRVGGIDPRIPIDDYPLAIKFARASEPAVTDEVVAYYRKIGGSASSGARAGDLLYETGWVALRQATYSPRLALRRASEQFYASSVYRAAHGKLLGAAGSAALSLLCWPSPTIQGARIKKGLRRAAKFVIDRV
jgi:glycosyltransferase involved in cell wall biosynthesis